jgi:hypothetical protein
MVLVSDIESDEILALSFWKSRQDAERYNREQYPKVNDIISQLVERVRWSRPSMLTSALVTRSHPKELRKLREASFAARLLSHADVGFKLPEGQAIAQNAAKSF